MKKVVLVISIVLLVVISTLAFSACTNQTSTDKLLRRNWCENDFVETFTYSVAGAIDDQDVTGTLTMTIAKYADGYLLTLAQNMSNDDSSLGQVYFKSSGSSSAYVPSWSTKTSTISGTTKTQKVVYNGSSIDYYAEDAAVLSDNATKTSYDISTPYYDNMQFYTIIRGAGFDKNFSLSFNTFVPNDNKVVKLNCSLSSTETISMNVNGSDTSYDTQIVLISLTQSKKTQSIIANYATNDIDVNGYKVKQALVKFQESNFTYTLTNISVSK